ncbi:MULTISPECIES: neocarzinostatin apoprotein domain-containing protein [unclassified Streptomyces]|uniref:Neocarzinostatin apoprotein domain-containing protein n=1 Tax=Streptomyces sp. NBC_00060 TaxID=2975636 RepID=A0AAU2GUG6_9ACTN
MTRTASRTARSRRRRAFLGAAAACGTFALALVGAQPGSAAPAPDGPTLKVDRTTGIRDGDIVSFQITGGPPKEYVWVEQCVAAPGGGTACDENTARQFRVYPDGTYQVSPKKLYTRLDTPAGPADCRAATAANRCLLALTDNAGAVLTTVPLRFLPLAPLEAPPTLRATPNSGLTDGQSVHLSGQRYEPQYHIPILECLAGATDTFACRPGGRPPATTDQGRIDQESTLSVAFTTIDGRAVDCRKDNCELVAFASRYHGPSTVRTPISFAPVPSASH